MTKSERLDRLHQDAMSQFDDIQSALRDERLQCLQDRRFYSISGAQWEGPLGYQFENKPRFEVNKVHLAVIRIINEYRNSRVTVDFVAKDGAVDKVVHRCAGCALGMDGADKWPLKVQDYTMHFCKQACLDRYSADPAKAIAALKIKD